MTTMHKTTAKQGNGKYCITPLHSTILDLFASFVLKRVKSAQREGDFNTES